MTTYHEGGPFLDQVAKTSRTLLVGPGQRLLLAVSAVQIRSRVIASGGPGAVVRSPAVVHLISTTWQRVRR
jgi:hypothetical protein